MAKEKKEKKPKSKVRKILEGIGLGIFVGLIGFVSVVMITSTIERRNSTNPMEPARFGDLYFPLVVATNSMEPVYPTGTAIFISKQSPETIVKDFNSLTPSDVEQNIGVDLTFDDVYQEYPDISVVLTAEEYSYLLSLGKTFRTTTQDRPRHTMTHRLFMVHINQNVAEGQGKYLFFVAGINTNSGEASAPTQYQVFTEKQLYGRVIGHSDFVGWIFKNLTSPLGLIILLLIPSLYMVISSILDVVRAYQSDDEEVKEVGPGVVDTQSGEDPLKGISDKEKEKLKKQLLDEMMKGKEKK